MGMWGDHPGQWMKLRSRIVSSRLINDLGLLPGQFPSRPERVRTLNAGQPVKNGAIGISLRLVQGLGESFDVGRIEVRLSQLRRRAFRLLTDG